MEAEGRGDGQEESGGPIESYQDLEVWQRGMDLAQQVYGLTAGFPREERYG